MATQQQHPEPNERWKAQLKSRIDENLQKLLDDAKASYEQKVNETQPEDSSTRRKLYLEYLQTTGNLKTFAADEYQYAVEREKQDLQWCLKAQESSESQADSELEAELEALKEEQFAILNAIHMETASATTSAATAPAPQPETQAQTQHHDSDPFGFYDFSSLSPLFTPTQLPGIQSESEPESEEGSSEEESDDDGEDDESSDESETHSRTPSPSPPSTPPLSSAPTSASSSQYCKTPHSHPVQDEEARLRAERNAKQQEEFHRRAEEIRRRNQEKQRLKEEGESAVRRLEAPSLYYSDEDSTRYTTTSTLIFTSASSSASAYASTSTSASTSTFASASTSASSSAASSSCNSPMLPQSNVPSSSLDPFVIAPLCEEDMVRLFIFHDQQWTRIASYNSLQWSDFPWPVLNFIGPRSERELTMSAVSDYIFAAFDWETERARSKERLREHIRKWHPDRFEGKFLVRVPEARGERERVRYGAGLVVRHLTELLGKCDDFDG